MDDLISKIKNSIINNKNIIIIYSVEDYHLSYFRNELNKLLKSNEYAIFKGISAYNYHCKLNASYVDFKHFWIEEKNKDLLLSIFDDYDYYEVL